MKNPATHRQQVLEAAATDERFSGLANPVAKRAIRSNESAVRCRLHQAACGLIEQGQS